MRLSTLGCLVLVLFSATACQPSQLPLSPVSQQQAAGARQDDFPRIRHDSLPVGADEIDFDDCGIERVQGATVTQADAEGIVVADQPVTMSGWAVAPEAAPGIPDAWIRLLPLDPSLTPAQFPLVAHYPRPDVAQAQASSQATFSGFTHVTVAGLPPGRYHAQVVFASQAGRWTCRQVREVALQ
ncbi:hypothetical protein [Arenimonas alkanexedens]